MAEPENGTWCKIWTAVMLWAEATGVHDIKDKGLIHLETDPWEVTLNGSREKVEGIPPFGVRLFSTKDMTMVFTGPRGGFVHGLATDDEIISHFDKLREAELARKGAEQ